MFEFYDQNSNDTLLKHLGFKCQFCFAWVKLMEWALVLKYISTLSTDNNWLITVIELEIMVVNHAGP